MSLSFSSLTFLSLVLVSGRSATLDNASTKGNIAATRSAVSAAFEEDGALKLRMTCFSRSLGSKGLAGRSRGWSVTFAANEGAVRRDRVHDVRKASGSTVRFWDHPTTWPGGRLSRCRRSHQQILFERGEHGGVVKGYNSPDITENLGGTPGFSVVLVQVFGTGQKQ